MFTSPGDIAFSLGSVSVYYYGIIMAVSLFVGVFVARLMAGKFYPEINPEIVYDISPYVIIGAILGARIYYCLLTYNYYAQNPFEIIKLWHGGISIHGAIIGGLIGGIIYAKRHKLPILKLCDIFSYGLVLGQAIGRWGNFFNSEAFGDPAFSATCLYVITFPEGILATTAKTRSLNVFCLFNPIEFLPLFTNPRRKKFLSIVDLLRRNLVRQDF